MEGEMAKPKKEILNMTDDEMKQELTDMITRDVMGFVETVTRHRIGLFVEEIYKGIKR